MKSIRFFDRLFFFVCLFLSSILRDDMHLTLVCLCVCISEQYVPICMSVGVVHG
jgi:hypothetical protein